jgi:uncharacterized cupredoxin-like copper-binding protein
VDRDFDARRWTGIDHEETVMKPDTGHGRARRRLRRLTVLGAGLAIVLTGACGNSPSAKPPAGVPTPTPTAAPTAVPAPTLSAAPAVITEDQYLQNPMDFNGAVDWNLKVPIKVDLDEMFFKPKELILRAGIPYVLELKNTGGIVHEFTAAEFFKSSSVRKIATEGGEVRVPYFTGIKVEPGKTVNVFAIPIIPGKFDIFCSIEGHREAGMVGGITVVGPAPDIPVPVLGSLKSAAWLQNGPAIIKAAAPTWDAKAKKVRIEAGEASGGMYFKPKQLVLKKGVPYVITLVNKGTILHEYTADDFFPTVAFVKAKDVSGEYTSPLLKEAEVLAKKELDLYLIPTKAGTFQIVCKLPGHEMAGMVGTIKVTG